MKSSNIGGQAVIEGIMMRHGDDYAVAVQKTGWRDCCTEGRISQSV